MPEAIPDDVRAFRAEYRKAKIGARYRGELHAAFTFTGSLVVLVLSAGRVVGPSLTELAVVPITLVVANFVEYFGHRGPMHKRRPGLGLLFKRHTLEHHHFFTHAAMAYESHRDVKMVLFPPVMLLFFLGGVAAPLAWALFTFASANSAWLFVVSAVGYFATYEICHFAHHLDEERFPGKLGFLRAIRRHHRLHHDKRAMTSKNFNVTIPLADLVMGTYARSKDVSRP